MFGELELFSSIYQLFVKVMDRRTSEILTVGGGGVLEKKVFLKILQKFAGKHLCQGLFLNKVAKLDLQLY